MGKSSIDSKGLGEGYLQVVLDIELHTKFLEYAAAKHAHGKCEAPAAHQLIVGMIERYCATPVRFASEAKFQRARGGKKTSAPVKKTRITLRFYGPNRDLCRRFAVVLARHRSHGHTASGVLRAAIVRLLGEPGADRLLSQHRNDLEREALWHKRKEREKRLRAAKAESWAGFARCCCEEVAGARYLNGNADVIRADAKAVKAAVEAMVRLHAAILAQGERLDVLKAKTAERRRVELVNAVVRRSGVASAWTAGSVPTSPPPTALPAART